MGLNLTKLGLSRAVDAPGVLPVIPENKKLFPFQKVLIEYSKLAPNVLLADPPGVGKTIQEISFLTTSRVARALIVAPASLLFNWARELKEWAPSFERVEIFSPKKFNPKNPPDILLMSYNHLANAEAVKLVLKWGAWQHLTFDECHYLKNPQSNRTKFALAKNGLISRPSTVHALSGTPMVNRPIELYPIIKALAPSAISHMTKFEYGLEYCAGKKLPWGWDFTGASKLPILGQYLRSEFMLRRIKKDVLPQLPERYSPRLIYAKPNTPAKEALSRIEPLEKEILKKRTASVAFNEVSTARRELGLSKVPFTVEYVTELVRSGFDRILLFAHHKEVIAELELGLTANKIKCGVFKGGMSAEAKDAAVNDFQKDLSGVQVFIVSLTAGGVGITLTRSDYIIFCEYSWVHSENEQAIDRAHRIGQERGVMIDFIVYEKTMDERILKISFTKDALTSDLLET